MCYHPSVFKEFSLLGTIPTAECSEPPSTFLNRFLNCYTHFWSVTLQCEALREVLAINVCDTTFIPMATCTSLSIGKLHLTARCHLRAAECIKEGVEPCCSDVKWVQQIWRLRWDTRRWIWVDRRTVLAAEEASMSL